MAKKNRKAWKETGHTHEWYPIAIDEEHEFTFYECVGCTETMWRNAQASYPLDAIE